MDIIAHTRTRLWADLAPACRALQLQDDLTHKKKALHLDALRILTRQLVRQGDAHMAAFGLIQFLNVGRSVEFSRLCFKDIAVEFSRGNDVIPDPLELLVFCCDNLKARSSYTAFDSKTGVHVELGLCPMFHFAMHMVGHAHIAQALADIQSNAMHEVPIDDFQGEGRLLSLTRPRWAFYKLFPAGRDSKAEGRAFRQEPRSSISRCFRAAINALPQEMQTSNTMHALRNGGLQQLINMGASEPQQAWMGRWGQNSTKGAHYDIHMNDFNLFMGMCGHEMDEGSLRKNHYTPSDWSECSQRIRSRGCGVQLEQLEQGIFRGLEAASAAAAARWALPDQDASRNPASMPIDELRKFESNEGVFLHALGRLRAHFLAGMYHIQQVIQGADSCGRQPAMQLPVFSEPGMQQFVCNVVNDVAQQTRQAKLDRRDYEIRSVKAIGKSLEARMLAMEQKGKRPAPPPFPPQQVGQGLPSMEAAKAAIAAAGMQPPPPDAKQEVDWDTRGDNSPGSIWSHWAGGFRSRCIVGAHDITLDKGRYFWRQFKDLARTQRIKEPGGNFTSIIRAPILLMDQQIRRYNRQPDEVIGVLAASKESLGLPHHQLYQGINFYLQAVKAGTALEELAHKIIPKSKPEVTADKVVKYLSSHQIVFL